MPTTLSQKLADTLAIETKFRRAQIEKAWFDVDINGYDEITTLPLELRTKLKSLPWLSLSVKTELVSQLDNTRKYLLELQDGNYIEMVLMGRKSLREVVNNLSLRGAAATKQSSPPTSPPLVKIASSAAATRLPRNDSPQRYTVCISSQAGCPMRCAFCATGKSGFKRNLTAEEIVDQYRLVQRILAKESLSAGRQGARLNNIVIMGQGEPLLNYDNIKRALNILLKNTDLGETKITLSTAGVVPAMEQMLKDKDFPAVRFAISLHSAIEATRKQIMPSHKAGFLDFLVDWAKDYEKRYGTRTHFIGLEYIMLSGVNDDEKHLQALIKLARRLSHVRINLIPFNTASDTEGKNSNLSSAEERLASGPSEVSPHQNNKQDTKSGSFGRTPHELIEHWHKTLMAAGFTSTIRYSQGQDISAACGQLANKTK